MHCHLQIEYRSPYIGVDSTESTWGFDPTNEEDRKTAHLFLDEYLDHLAKVWTKLKAEGKVDYNEPKQAGLHISPFIHG